MMRCLIFLSILFYINYPVIFGQQPDYVRGKVIDSKTSQPVPFATVRLKTSQIGVLTNTEGDFKILNSLRFQSDSFMVSCIGFQRTSMAYSTLKTSGMNIIKLVPDIYSLNEVTVTAKRKRISPIVVVSRALRNIKKTHPDKPFSYISYYRDYLKDNSNNYLNLNEAIIQTLDKGFTYSSDSSGYRLLDFRKNTDFIRTKITPYYNLPGTDHSEESFKKIPHATVGDQFGNELFILLVHDAIRNFDKRSFSFIDTLTKDFIRNHRFSEPIGIHDGGTLLYKINFISKRQITGNSIQMKGAIFIQPDDYSIHKLEYLGSFLDKEEKYREIFNIELEYVHEPAVNSKMCLKYISFRNLFTLPDSTDNDYFKMEKLLWRNSPLGPFPDMTIIVSFNRNIDPVIAGKTDNYDLTIGKRKAKITKVLAKGPHLFITVRDDKFKHEEMDSTIININNLKDINGNILNKRRDLEFHQFRELFVQEYNKPLEFQDSCFVQAMPLEQNCISTANDLGRFWMNTPLKTEENQHVSPTNELNNLDSLVNVLNGKLVTVENVYIETDRNNYLAGDTIWFSAFIMDNLLMDSTSLSKILYVDLINPDNKPEKHIKLLISNGRAKGDFELYKDAENGLYRLRAYTQYMRNFQSEFLFEKDIPVYQSDFTRHILVNPVLNKNISGDSVELYIRTILPDEYKSLEKKLEVLVKLNDTLSIRRTFNFKKVLNGSMGFFVPSMLNCSSVEIILTLSDKTVISTQNISLQLSSDIMLQFFPESGKLIDGIENVVAYKAVDNAGNPKEFDADIVDENQNIITHIIADRRGVGKFVITPECSHNYKAILTSTGCTLAGNKYVFNLPEIEPKGYVLNFYTNSDKILIKNNQNIVKRRHYLLVSVRGMVCDSYEVKLDTGTYELYLPFKTYPKGIVQITLYDSLFHPQAERLVFNNRPDQKMLIHVEADKKEYLNKEKVNLTINVKDVDGYPDESSLSISVVDDSKCDSLFNFPDIESYLYITSELKGKVDYSLLNLADTTDEGNTKRDIVMMIQGWRNFLWNSIRYNNASEISYPIEKGLFVDGTVFNYNKRRSSGDFTINFLDFNSGFNGFVTLDKSNKFEIESPLFYDSHDFFIQTSNKKNKRTVNVGITLDTVPMPDIDYRNNELPYSSHKAGYLGALDEKFTFADSIYATDIKYINLPEVRIKARLNPTIFTPDVEIDLNKTDPTGKRYSNLFQMIHQEFGEKAFTATGYGTNGKMYNPILVVNGAPLTASECPPCYDFSAYAWATAIPINEISDVKFYEAESKYSQWLSPPPHLIKDMSEWVKGLYMPPVDPKIYFPVVSFKTYSNSYRGYPKGAIFFTYQGLYNAREFYQPVYENNNNIPDNRTTIFWNPEIKTDSTGIARVSFYNSDLKGKTLIRVSGVSFNLKDASSSISYYLSH